VRRGGRSFDTNTADVSTTGVGFESDQWFELGQNVEVVISPNSPSRVVANARITSCRKAAGGFRVGAEFVGFGRDSERRLVLMLFQGVAPEKVHESPPETGARRAA
jgi:hypothetical protein